MEGLECLKAWLEAEGYSDDEGETEDEGDNEAEWQDERDFATASPLLFCGLCRASRLYLRPILPRSPTVLMHLLLQAPPRHPRRRFVPFSFGPWPLRLRLLTSAFRASTRCHPVSPPPPPSQTIGL
jgi:hypothetical protein